MTEVWVCPGCGHEFNPREQEPYWDGDSVLIDCPECGGYMNTAERFARGWRKNDRQSTSTINPNIEYRTSKPTYVGKKFGVRFNRNSFRSVYYSGC